MIQRKDVYLLLVIFVSIFMGVAFPGLWTGFSWFPKYGMMALLFFSFLSMAPDRLVYTLFRRPAWVGWLLAVKLILLPAVVYAFFLKAAPGFAVAALLLSGISTGVVAPFFADMLEGDAAMVVVVVVASTLLIPFSLPLLVHLLAGRHITISLWAMVSLLSQVVFLPIFAVGLIRKLRPSIIPGLVFIKQPLTYIIFAVTNLAVFSGYADFFRNQPSTVLTSLGLAFGLSGVYFAAGLLFSLKKPVADKVSAIISLGSTNNVLAIVFAAQFFGPLEPILAATYFIPFFILILPLRVLASRLGPAAS